MLVQEVFGSHVPLHLYRGYLIKGETIEQGYAVSIISE